MGRTCTNKLPFFFNSARLRTAESYFKQNYNPIELNRQSLLSSTESNRRDSSTSCNAWTCSIPEESLVEEPTSVHNGEEYDVNNNVKVNDDEIQFAGLGFLWNTLQKLTVAFRYVIGKNKDSSDIEAPATLENPPEIEAASFRQPSPSREVFPETHTIVVPFIDRDTDQSDHKEGHFPPSEPNHPMEIVALGKHISWDELGEVDLLSLPDS